jgi:hypothetical protein
MFTVKLIRGKVTKIVGANSINIFPAGKPAADDTVKEANQTVPEATNQVREMSVETINGGQPQTFFIGYEGAACIHGKVELWDVAYIENANGATTERVCAY